MNNKYELTSESKEFCGHALFRIKALVSFGNVVKGEVGGYIESERNLSEYGDAWVYENARVSGDARVKISTDYFTVYPIGSRNSSITFTKSNKSVTTGCFHGSLSEFVKQVTKTHGTNQHATNYLALVKFVKTMWKE